MPPRSRPLLAAALALVLGACAAPAGASPAASTTPSPAVTAAPTVGPTPTVSATSTPSPTPTASPTPVAAERITVLLIGLDTLAGRTFTELTDSLIVASVDPVAGTASLLALPRDLTDFPLPDGSTYRGKLNAMYTEVRRNPGRFPGAEGVAPEAYLATVIGGVLDVPIGHWATIDMDGFADLVDAVGGVDVYVEKALCDPGYRSLGVQGFEAAAGWWHLTGPQALALARVRKDAGGSDFQRMRRQQDLLVAIRDAVVASGADRNPAEWIPKVPVLRTDMSAGEILATAAIVAGMPFENIRSRLIQPFGWGGTEGYDSRGYVLSANMDEIREASTKLFTTPGKVPSSGKQEPPPPKPPTVPPLPRFNGC